MAKFAPVAPPHVLRKLREVGDFVLGRYHLLLAHDVAANPDSYRGLFNTSMFVIMDNSMVELGQPVDFSIIESACIELRDIVTCVVLPDVRDDMQKTVELSKQMHADYLKLPGNPALMAVPQGKALEEYVECAKQLRELEGVRFWGIPRTAVQTLGSRHELTRRIAELGTKTARGWNNIHQLGFSDDLKDDIASAKMAGVMGIDSAVPIRLGQDKVMLDPDATDFGKRGDFWTRACEKIEPETLANIYMLRHWIA